MITIFQHNTSQHCWAQHVARFWPPCCDVLGFVGSNLKLVKFFIHFSFNFWMLHKVARLFGQVPATMLCPGMRTISIFNTQHVATRRNGVTKRVQHVKPRPNYRNISTQHIATYRNIVGCNMLSAFGHPVAACCDMLGAVGSNLKMVKFFLQHLWTLHDVGIVWRQCCAWACALVFILRFSTRNMSQHVATGWPNACNILRPTMLRSVAFKSWDRLAGACKCWANIVGICCVEMLLSFGRGFTPNNFATCCIHRPELANAGPIMLGYGMMICANRLAGV